MDEFDDVENIDIECTHHEQMLVATILDDPESVYEVYSDLTPYHFWHASHRYIWRAIEACIEEGSDPWLLEVIAKLSEHDAIDDLSWQEYGGRGYLEHLDRKEVGPGADLGRHADKIVEFYHRRQIAGASRRAYYRLKQREWTAKEARSALHEAMTETSTESATGAPIDEVADEVLDDMRAIEAGETTPYFPTGVSPLDDVLGGGLALQRLYFIAARPKMGKTSLAVAAVAGLIERHDFAVDFWYVDGSRKDLGVAFLSLLSRVENEKIREADLTDDEREDVLDAREKFDDWDLEIKAVGSPHPDDIAVEAEARASKCDRYACVVDYVQECDAGFRGGSADRKNIQYATKRLADIRSDHENALTIGLAQFNRGGSGSSLPRASQLKGSGQLEESVNDLLVWHRPRFGDDFDSKAEKLKGERFGILDRQMSKHAQRSQKHVDALLGINRFQAYREAAINQEVAHNV